MAEMTRKLLALLAPAFMLLVAGGTASAQQMPSTCHAVAERGGNLLHRASVDPSTLGSGEVAITYVGHAAFRIETRGGTSVVTDYNGMAGAGGPPTAVTMNHAHSTHYTDYPDPAIEHVLRGWNPSGDGPAQHYLQLSDMLIRNVPTDLYYNGIMTEKDGNSIFIFEAEGLCIGHLGHLHHKLTPEHIAMIGRIDVLFVPVDGTYTMSQGAMIELAEMLRSSIVIPMHFFSNYSLQRFVTGMEAKFVTRLAGGNRITVSLADLPSQPTVMVMLPY